MEFVMSNTALPTCLACLDVSRHTRHTGQRQAISLSSDSTPPLGGESRTTIDCGLIQQGQRVEMIAQCEMLGNAVIQCRHGARATTVQLRAFIPCAGRKAGTLAY